MLTVAACARLSPAADLRRKRSLGAARHSKRMTRGGGGAQRIRHSHPHPSSSALLTSPTALASSSAALLIALRHPVRWSSSWAPPGTRAAAASTSARFAAPRSSLAGWPSHSSLPCTSFRSCGSAAATQPPANGAPVAAPTATATAPADAAPHTTPAATVTGSSSTATTITTTTKGSTAPAADSAAATVSDASTANATTNGVTISAPISLATIVTADNASTAAVPTPTVARAKVAVVYYSTWGHRQLHPSHPLPTPHRANMTTSPHLTLAPSLALSSQSAPSPSPSPRAPATAAPTSPCTRSQRRCRPRC